MKRWINRVIPLAALVAGGLLLVRPGTALAVPSFARQTGLPCEACHTVAPQLTPFGRYFKIHGYVLSSTNLQTAQKKGTPPLSISKFPPISAMLLVSDTVLNKAQPGTQNGSIAFPDQLSLFYAGRIASHMGAFSQFTYDSQGDHFSMDNTDVRWAHDAQLGSMPVVWGLTLNNNPTVEDPWNSTPAWGFPYLGSPSAPGPDAAPMVESLGGMVAGLGAYAWINNSIYAELTLYRSSEVGQPQPLDSTATDVIKNVAPYWRVGWQHDWNQNSTTNSLEVGTFGMEAHMYPGGGEPLSGPTDDYTDIGVDSQYQMLFGSHSSMTIHASYIHEKQQLNASYQDGLVSNVDNHLNTWQLSGQYYWSERFGPSLAYFDTTGSSDQLLYQGNRITAPNSSGWIFQWTYLPAENVQLALQYTLYNKFDGASSNYDGSGRSASDNNTLYLTAWFLW